VFPWIALSPRECQRQSNANGAACASNLSDGGLDLAGCYVPAVRREFSAGGVLVRRLRGRWAMAAIRPGGKPEGVWALPKGLIGPGEDPAATALREVEEETGVRGRLDGKLGDVRYVYTWAGERVFKVVSFYLLRYSQGRLGDLPPATAHEVAETRWLPLEDGPKLLAYKGEQEMAAKALDAVRAL
jgi:8-oxo-dGTP diphosphatase